MADAVVLLVFLVLSLSLLSASSSPTSISSVPAVRAASAADMAEQHEYTFVAISSLKPKAACTGHRVSPPHGHQNATWLRLSLSHGPCSPPSHRRRKGPSLSELLRQDELRVQNIQMTLLSSAGDNAAADDDEKAKVHKHPAKSVTTTMEHGPVLAVNVGSAQSISTSSIDPMADGGGGGGRRRSMPGTVQTMMVDTASDVPWVQCHPPPTGGGGGSFFDPTRSPTYAAFPCGSPACAALGPYSNGCINGQCQYRVTSADGSSTLGTYSSDVLTITRSAAVRTFQFGCSQAEQGSSSSTTTTSSGTMSLGGGSQSLVSQTAATHGNAFSYCVPPTASDAGFFVLGRPPPSSRAAFVTTPMVGFSQSASTLYGVLLRDITVAGQPLGVAAGVFAAGAVMDSRTAVTRLPATAYRALRDAFRSRMGAAYRPAPPRGSLDTCYDFAGVPVVRVPRVALVFDRSSAAVELDASGILLDGCLAFAPNADDRAPGIVGNVQQQTIEVLYDVGGRSVGFRQGAC